MAYRVVSSLRWTAPITSAVVSAIAAISAIVQPISTLFVVMRSPFFSSSPWPLLDCDLCDRIAVPGQLFCSDHLRNENAPVVDSQPRRLGHEPAPTDSLCAQFDRGSRH